MIPKISYLKIKDYAGNNVWIVNNVAYDYNPFDHSAALEEDCAFYDDEVFSDTTEIYECQGKYLEACLEISSSFLPVISE